MEDCIFCKISAGEIPSEKILETDNFFVIKDINPKYGREFYFYLGLSILGVIVFTGFLYLPIIFSSGLQSIVGNEVIEALSWSDFTQSLLPRIKNTWNEWNRSLPQVISYIAIGGLLASFFVPKLPGNRRVPLVLAGLLWIATALLIQRVAPWPRIWLFLLPFFVIWITAGIVGLFSLVPVKFEKSELLVRGLTISVVVCVLAAGLIRTYPQFTEKLFAKGEIEQVADYLEDFLQQGDVVVITSPDTVVLKYYLMRNNLPNEFTELVQNKDVNRSIVVVNQALGQTLEYVLERRSYQDDVELALAEEVYRSRRFIIFQIPKN